MMSARAMLVVAKLMKRRLNVTCLLVTAMPVPSHTVTSSQPEGGEEGG